MMGGGGGLAEHKIYSKQTENSYNVSYMYWNNIVDIRIRAGESLLTKLTNGKPINFEIVNISVLELKKTVLKRKRNGWVNTKTATFVFFLLKYVLKGRLLFPSEEINNKKDVDYWTCTVYTRSQIF